MVAVSCLGQVLGGCGALTEDTPDHADFALPTFRFTVSSESQQWRHPPPVEIPNGVCAGPLAIATDCCSPPLALQAIDCQQYPLACNPADNTCALIFDMVDSVDVDLASQVPAIAAVQGRIFSSVSLLGLTTKVTDLAELPILSAALYVAPADSGSPASPGANLLAPVSLAAAPNVIVPDEAAQRAFATFAANYQTPFSLLLSAHLVIAGDAVPTGSVNFDVSGQARGFY
jgi:hypothetical protein